MMRLFKLVRFKDVTGKSGVGIIGEGATCTGGGAFLHWMTDYESFVYWPGGVEAILAVHGHEGATIARYLDDEPQLPTSLGPDWDEQLGNAKYDGPGLTWESHDDPEVNR